MSEKFVDKSASTRSRNQRDKNSAVDPSHVRISFGKLSQPSIRHSHESLIADGVRLVNECLDGLNQQLFPPKLFILWACPIFLGDDPQRPYEYLLAGIGQRLVEMGLGDVPLVGASVAACWFDAQTHDEGAVLICIASNMIEAHATVAIDAQPDPRHEVSDNKNAHAKNAGEQILAGLGLTKQGASNPRGNRSLILFLPGFGPDGDQAPYNGHEIVATLRRRTFGQLPMFGGVASGGLQPQAGFQFKNRTVYQRAAVAALLSLDVSFGIGLCHGLVEVAEADRRHLHVEKLDRDSCTIRAFREGSPQDATPGPNKRNVSITLRQPPLEFSVATASNLESSLVPWGTSPPDPLGFFEA